jgi:ABC-type dipeptide/oligopeptide/nickel transport system ATPase component
VFGQACGFAPRCPFAQDDCHKIAPVLETVDAGLVRCLRWRDFTSTEGLA